ncbi:MAG TPA: hypothetical protein VHD88_02040, partial [Pyrinomonadaceae bacterium]|nr:hypothetical protein [Pyrinomonadaceae bacterium]
YRAIKVNVTDASGQKRIALTRSGRTAGQGANAAKPATRTSVSPTNNNARQPTTNATRKSP